MNEDDWLESDYEDRNGYPDEEDEMEGEDEEDEEDDWDNDR